MSESSFPTVSPLPHQQGRGNLIWSHSRPTKSQCIFYGWQLYLALWYGLSWGIRVAYFCRIWFLLSSQDLSILTCCNHLICYTFCFLENRHWKTKQQLKTLTGKTSHTKTYHAHSWMQLDEHSPIFFQQRSIKLRAVKSQLEKNHLLMAISPPEHRLIRIPQEWLRLQHCSSKISCNFCGWSWSFNTLGAIIYVPCLSSADHFYV